MCLPHSLDEVDHGNSIFWNTVVRPGQVVELSDLKGRGAWLLRLRGDQIAKKPAVVNQLLFIMSHW
jgi:hypothetical protein